MDTQPTLRMEMGRTAEEVVALQQRVAAALFGPELKAAGRTWEREGQEFTRLWNIAGTLDWALGKVLAPPEESPEVSATLDWLAGYDLAPIGEDGFTPRYRRRVA